MPPSLKRGADQVAWSMASGHCSRACVYPKIVKPHKGKRHVCDLGVEINGISTAATFRLFLRLQKKIFDNA